MGDDRVFLQVRIRALVEVPTDAPSLADALGVDPVLSDLFATEAGVLKALCEVVGVVQVPGAYLGRGTIFRSGDELAAVKKRDLGVDGDV